ncbi:MAG: J domain-containing protein, partial [Cyanobacteria bacterium J06633_1]
MRIPLDYYRILSVPVKATAAQLKQAYNDRLLQQPRREYSDESKEARQQLIQHAYELLCDQKQRADYDAQFLLNMQALAFEETAAEDVANIDTEEAGDEIAEAEISAPLLGNPTIEILPQQIVGALLILHELGEYETVLNIGIDAFNQKEAEKESLPEEKVELSLDTIQEDLILTLTLAYMELGREQWHRREYENSAVSGQLGIDLLRQKSLFPHLQSELELDLAKLRPYRVLELISQNPANSPARASGFQLLQSMLIQRQGIEGKGQDRSGLNFDQFLCFVQQLRTYLTSAEQQQLFDNESQSKSAIANYLAVYALLGRGF